MGHTKLRALDASQSSGTVSPFFWLITVLGIAICLPAYKYQVRFVSPLQPQHPSTRLISLPLCLLASIRNSLSRMTNATLFVVFYAPLPNSMAHWAIYLCVEDGNNIKHRIYQAAGDEGALEFERVKANPRNSARFRGQIKVSDIDHASDITRIKRKLKRQPMKNHIASWNCQDWVMEALETLDGESLLDEYQYNEAKDALMNYFHTY